MLSFVSHNTLTSIVSFQNFSKQNKTKTTLSLTASNQIETDHPNRLFSGILSCGFNIPVLGGRPYEIACEQRRNARQLKRKSTASTATA